MKNNEAMNLRKMGELKMKLEEHFYEEKIMFKMLWELSFFKYVLTPKDANVGDSLYIFQGEFICYSIKLSSN